MLEVTKKELDILPQWARVAFSVRCAHRVSGFYAKCLREPSERDCEAISSSVRLISRGAGRAYVDDADCEQLTSDVMSASRRAMLDPNYVDGVHHNPLILTAQFVCYVLVKALQSTEDRDGYASAQAAHGTLEVVQEFNYGDGFLASRVASTQRYDFLMLKRLAEIHGWDDNSPVPPEICGRIWPQGVPEKWPLDDYDAAGRKSGEFVDLTFDIPPDVDDETISRRSDFS